MLKDTIEKFKEKHSGFKFEEFIQSYLDGESRLELCSKYNVSEMPLRGFLARLGLDFPKSRRYNSFEDFKYRISLENNITDVNALVEVENDVKLLAEDNRKLRKALVLARDSNNALRKEVRVEVRNEDVVEHLLEAFKHKIEAMEFTPPKPIIVPQEYFIRKIQRKGLCAIISDVHAGDEVISEVTPYNNYNYEIMEKRMLKVANEVILFGKQSNELTMFHLLDDLKGILHSGLYTSLDGLTTSMLKIVEAYVKVYDVLIPYYDSINIYVTNSNHDRKTDKPTSTDKWDNFGIMLAKFLEMVLRAKGHNNVNFHYTKHDYHLVKINGANIFAFHGDSIRTFKPYNPTEISKAQDICLGMFKETFKHTINGHFHIGNVCANQYGGVSISNGTLVGNTEYGTSNGFRSIIPSQTIFFVNKEGNIEDTKLINLASII